MICSNCNREIGQSTACKWCGYNPSIDDFGDYTYRMQSDMIKPPPVKIILRKRNNGMAVASLIVSLLGFFFPGLSVLSFIFAIIGLKRSKYYLTGKGMSIWGLLLSIAAIIMYLIPVVLYIAVIVYAFIIAYNQEIAMLGGMIL